MRLGVRVRAAEPKMAVAVAGPPVNVILAMSGCDTSAAPVSDPTPVTMFSTPGGRASPITVASSRMLAEAYSDGFTTMVLPPARAGATLLAKVMSGEFHDSTAATTPSGSRFVYSSVSGFASGICSPLKALIAPA